MPEDMKIKNLIKELVNISEKGANVARIIRSEETLLDLLVQEKIGDQKNDRFVHDFKTLADVLVQQIVSHDLSLKFPGVKDSIYGEESNKFTNAIEETITVEIMQTPQKTADLLCKVLNGHENAANLLAKVVHEHVSYDPGEKIDDIGSGEIDDDDVAVWIDPIDSTAQYIGGKVGIPNEHGFVRSGLQCACVLIGVYSKETGLPIAGVINQPFACKDDKSGRWISANHWGVSLKELSVHSTTKAPVNKESSSQILLTSASDTEETGDKFSKAYTVHHASGAGYKLLCVILGLADAYILSKNSTYKWDTCAPHAILLAQGGGVISYKNLLELSQGDSSGLSKFSNSQILYSIGENPGDNYTQNSCNSDGIVAYKSHESLKRIVNALKSSQ